MLISVPYIYIVAVLFVIWTIYRIIAVLKSKKKIDIGSSHKYIFHILLILMGLTIFKGSNLSIMFENKLYVNYIPFMETINMFKNNYMNYMGIRNAVYNVVGNILVFVPLVFFIPLLFEMKNKIIYIALYGFLTSLAIDFVQLFTAFNITDIDDIIFNTLGSIFGFIIYNLFYYIIKKTKLGYLFKKVTSEFNGSLLALSIKPLSIMVGVFLLTTIITIYNSTISANASNEDIAKVIFKDSSNTGFQAVKDLSDHKLFLKDEEDYVQLIRIETVWNDRWLAKIRFFDSKGNEYSDMKLAN